MTRRRLIIGNWKMNTTRTEAIGLATELIGALRSGDVDIAVCPPLPWIEVVARVLAGSGIAVGAQDCWPEPRGAFTGQVSAKMLSELCSLVIVGHSEHRRDAAESDELVARKACAVLAEGLTPIICVGESLKTRQSMAAERWVSEQVDAVLSVVETADLVRCVFAYEPIWAIGTGISAGASDARQMAKVIRDRVSAASQDAAEQVRILYGGSVVAGNAAMFSGEPDVDGLLVGGACLQAESFMNIVAAC